MIPSYQAHIIKNLEAQFKQMVQQLHAFCLINSGTENLAGLRQMQQVLQQAFHVLTDDIQTMICPGISTIKMDGALSYQAVGDALLIRKRPELSRRVLLVGHMDTVYGIDSPFQNLTLLDENRLCGPGVTDMKGGLVVMLHALQAFETLPEALSLGWDVFINADEEIGSLGSNSILATLAPQYNAALVYEPAMTASGTMAKNRKGSGKFTLVATGKSAHAGRAFDEGRNAICFLAEVICAIHAQNGKRAGVTINVGKIAGGSALNVVPDCAVVKLDIRMSEADDAAWVLQQIETIIHDFSRAGYGLTLHHEFPRPVKRVNAATEHLFMRVQKIGKTLGINIDWADSGGCCDGNNLAQCGVPVIDTLGVRGGNIHSIDEYILLDSLKERAILSTLLLADLAINL